MAKFIFKLQKLLTIKEKIEKRAFLEFGAAMSVWEKKKKEKNRLQTSLEKCVEAFRENARAGAKPLEAIMYNGYIDALGANITEKEAEIADAEKQVKLKRLVLAEAAKERRVLENLRDRRREAYLATEQLAERRAIDEHVSYRFGAFNEYSGD
ncbi:MAG: flagellar export protein FliJ [Clostridiales bacterium]|jgi:flagellar FliJ protein|nr:flagellar export protein FliJ [Clostridiales bacterium]